MVMSAHRAEVGLSEALGPPGGNISHSALVADVHERFPSLERTLKDRVKLYVALNMADPDLSVATVALALHCTKRYLHKVFSAERETLGSYIWSLRLERCREELAARANRCRPITDIAFSWGFSSSSHFSRAFKARYGESPRQYRSSRLRACDPSANGAVLVPEIST